MINFPKQQSTPAVDQGRTSGSGRPIRVKWTTRIVVDQGSKNAVESEWDSNGPIVVGSGGCAHLRLSDPDVEAKACAITTDGASIVVTPLEAALKHDWGFRELNDGTLLFEGEGLARVQVGSRWLTIQRRIQPQPRAAAESVEGPQTVFAPPPSDAARSGTRRKLPSRPIAEQRRAPSKPPSRFPRPAPLPQSPRPARGVPHASIRSALILLGSTLAAVLAGLVTSRLTVRLELERSLARPPVLCPSLPSHSAPGGPE